MFAKQETLIVICIAQGSIAVGNNRFNLIATHE